MPKQLYGHKNPKNKPPPCDDSSIWLTLMAGLPEERQHRAILAAASEVGLDLSAELHGSFTAGLIEYASAQQADCDEAWIGVLLELCSDLGVRCRRCIGSLG